MDFEREVTGNRSMGGKKGGFSVCTWLGLDGIGGETKERELVGRGQRNEILK